MLKKTELNFEINLLPVFDILSVCICFLLVTVIWVQVAVVKSEQKLGQSGAAAASKVAIGEIRANGDFVLTLAPTPGTSGRELIKVPGVRGRLNAIQVGRIALSPKTGPLPQLAMVRSGPATPYEDIILVMDEFKRLGFTRTGILPL